MMELASTRGGDMRSIASTVYDTAWVAAIADPGERRNPRFPTALNWIIAHQHPDGSWGSTIRYEHDRVICTLAALIPLARFGRRTSDRLQVRRGERYLWQHAHLLSRMPCELVGFELLLPTLIQLALEAGIALPPHLDSFAAERDQKLALLPADLIYSPAVTLAHSLEFLGSDVDLRQLARMRAANGSVGNSPAATAYLLHYVDDPVAVAYLEHCLSGDNGDAVPVLEPCETYEALWVAYHRFWGGAPAETLLAPAFQAELVTALTANGVSLSPSFPVPDADDTAIALLLLHAMGIAVTPMALRQFEQSDYFVSFPYERHPSTGVNIHVLQVLTRYPDYPEREAAIAKILRYLSDARQQGSYWIDKWHLSPYYATCRAIIALAECAALSRPLCTEMIDAAVRWLLQTQNEDGSWGFSGMATAEETAYAVLALHNVLTMYPQLMAAINEGGAYLEAHQADPHPAMWLDKCLYHPVRIVDSAIDAALERARKMETWKMSGS